MMVMPYTLCQANSSNPIISSKLEFELDSIERRITINKWGIDSSYYLHYTVSNISEDTLNYITNSCFYYNQYTLQIDQLDFELNPRGGCLYNETFSHLLLPDSSFSTIEWITANNIEKLKPGVWTLALFVPLLQIKENTYHVSGIAKDSKILFLTFENKSKVVETVISKRKK